MKKLVLLFFLLINITFSLEVQSIDPLDFGAVVAGDRSVSLSGVGVYVKGNPGRSVEIEVPERYEIDGNEMRIKVERKKIILDNGGRGRFRLNVDLRLENTREYRRLTDKFSVKVRYTD